MKKYTSSFLLLLAFAIAFAQAGFARSEPATRYLSGGDDDGILKISSKVQQRQSEPEISHFYKVPGTHTSSKTQHAWEGFDAGERPSGGDITFDQPVFLTRGRLLIKSYLSFIYPSHNFW